MKTMRYVTLFFLFAASVVGNIGDQAPETIIAQIAKTLHPRLGRPDTTYLTSIWTGGTTGQVSVTRIKTAADNWNPASPLTDTTALDSFRYLLISYLACQQNGNATCQTTYLLKIQAMADINGGWSQLYTHASDGAASNNGLSCNNGGAVCTVTSATIDFTADCGGSCLNKQLAIKGYTFQIMSLTGTHQANLGPGGTSNPLPTGSAMGISVVASATNRYLATYGYAMAYDWIYSDLTTGQRASFVAALTGYAEQFESNYISNQPTAMGDQFYTRIQSNAFMAAFAVGTDDPGFMPHLRFELDVFWNQTFNMWKRVINGNANCQAENDAGTVTSGNAAQPGCGGGWHEPWNDYMSGCSAATCLNQTFVPTLLAFANATGRMTPLVGGVPEFFATEGWIKNYGYRMMYAVRPDFSEEPLGSANRAVWSGEYTGNAAASAQLGSADGLAEIYNDPTFRGWARLINRTQQGTVCCTVPDGFEPSAYPYYKPDAGAGATAITPNPRVNLSKNRLFQGWGKFFSRSGWGEDDCTFTASFGGNFWSHSEQDIGSFDVYCRGILALGWAGTYRAGSNSRHVKQYKGAGVGHNIMEVCDAADDYPDELIGMGRNDSTTTNEKFANDCGLRRDGSGFSNISGQMQQATGAPSDLAQYERAFTYYDMGSVIGYQVGTGGKYTLFSIDTTQAYNNPFSAGTHTTAWAWNQANSANRTNRVTDAQRHWVIMPRGSAMYVFIFDHVVSVNAGMTKKFLFHTVNQPTVGTWDGSRTEYSFSRTELADQIPYQFTKTWSAMLTHCPGGCNVNHSPYQQYQYAGTGWGWMTLPAAGVITKIGGPGREFEVTPPGGTPFNYNECLKTQCSSVHGSMTGMNTEPFTVTSSNQTFPIWIDAGGYQFVTLTTGTRTAQQIVNDINGQITGATATVEGVDPAAPAGTQGRVAITSNSTVPASSIVKLADKGTLAAIPATCTVGQQYYASDQSVNVRGYQCTALNTWTQITPSTANSAIGLLGFTSSAFMGPIPGDTANGDEGLDANAVADMIHPIATNATHEVGSWRLEETEATPQAETKFINVQLYTTTADTNLVVTKPATTEITPGTRACPASPNIVNCQETTWTDNGGACAYRITNLNNGTWFDVHTSGTCTQGTIN